MGIQKSNRLNVNDIQAPERELSPDEAKKVRGGELLPTKDPVKYPTTTTTTKTPLDTKTPTTTEVLPLIKYPIKP